MTIHQVFTEPAFARARDVLLRSATGREVVHGLEQLATRTRVFGQAAARTAPADAVPKLYGGYMPFANMMSINALSLRDDMTAALTLGHEGVHRLRRWPSMVGPFVGPFLALPDAAVDGARALRTGANPLWPMARAIDARTMHEEVVAFSTEAKIAQELGASPEIAPGLRADGTLKTPDEVLDMILSKRGYRQQAWVGRSMPVVAAGLGGTIAVRQLVRDDGASG